MLHVRQNLNRYTSSASRLLSNFCRIPKQKENLTNQNMPNYQFSKHLSYQNLDNGEKGHILSFPPSSLLNRYNDKFSCFMQELRHFQENSCIPDKAYVGSALVSDSTRYSPITHVS
jgi:hypothetical protein